MPAFVFAADTVGAAGTLPAVTTQGFAIRQGFDGRVKIVIRVAGALGFTYGLACAVHCKHRQAVERAVFRVGQLGNGVVVTVHAAGYTVVAFVIGMRVGGYIALAADVFAGRGEFQIAQ